MGPRSPVRVSVKGPDGRPVANARVWIEDAAEPMPDIAALSDSLGEVVIAAPNAGGFTIVCTADGFAPARQTIDGPVARPPTLVIALEDGP